MTRKLTREEERISADLSDGSFASLGVLEAKRYSEMARRDLKRRKDIRKEERINIRLTSDQLTRLKERAEQEGLPYQSLVASIIQKFLNGSLIEVTSLLSMKKILKAL
jgi:predicted DNA binding CopG/RHH family protein